ncbi:hypothetical protein B0H13DRAFT_1854973 [Mycena leptocephala]|nr:hypothetical protein B0H13DRAFT_1854973 [Mycena leptocephala]
MRVVSTQPRWMPSRKSLQAACQRKKGLDTSRTQPQTPSESTSLPSLLSDVPALEFPSSPTPMEPPSDDEELPASIAVPVRSTRSTKRKSDATSDISDADLAAPAKKKPTPKPKLRAVKPSSEVDASEESEPKPTRKKPGPKPKPKGKPVSKPRKSKKIVESDEDDIELVTPATVAPSKGKGKLAAMDLDHNESVGEDDDDEDVEAGEKKALSELDAEYRKCIRCGPSVTFKIDRGGNHVSLSFPQRRAWAVSLINIFGLKQ